MAKVSVSFEIEFSPDIKVQELKAVVEQFADELAEQIVAKNEKVYQMSVDKVRITI